MKKCCLCCNETDCSRKGYCTAEAEHEPDCPDCGGSGCRRCGGGHPNCKGGCPKCGGSGIAQDFGLG
jgi:hypothetical protein